MNKLKFFFLMIFATSYGYTQISIGFNRNIDFYKPYTKETQAYMQLNNKVKSSTFNAFLQYNIVERNKFSMKIGISYKNISYLVEDKILSYYEFEYSGHNSPTDYVLVNNPLDLKSKSHSLGTIFDFTYDLKETEKMKNEIGLSNEIYFFEFFKSAYYYSESNTIYENFDAYISPLVTKLPRNFFFSCANISIFHRLTFQQSEKFSFATKISLGTNLYSNWDQFKKYAWLGLGLELGFGKKKEKIKASK